MTNLLRVQQALAGVYVPPPAAVAADARGGEVLTKGEAETGETVGEGAREGGCEEAGADGGKGRMEVEGEVVPKVVTVVTVEAAEAGGVDRGKRRAEKVRGKREERKAKKREESKARKREERKARKRARREKEKEKGKDVDESE
jgi:hypothetical protein